MSDLADLVRYVHVFTQRYGLYVDSAKLSNSAKLSKSISGSAQLRPANSNSTAYYNASFQEVEEYAVVTSILIANELSIETSLHERYLQV